MSNGSRHSIGLCILAFDLLVSGCHLAPKYSPPLAATAPSFKEMTPAMAQAARMWVQANPQDDRTKGRWWTVFHDATLDALEARVASGSQTLAQYEAQFREARASARIAQAGLFPTLSASAEGITLSQSQNQTGVPSTLRIPGLNGSSNNNFQVADTFAWEPDLWGSVQDSIHEQKAKLQSSAATLVNVQLEIESEIATDYFDLRGQDGLIQLLEETVDQDRKFLDLTESRFTQGVASEQDTAQAQTQLESAETSLADAQIARAQYEHAIAVLIGKATSEFFIPRSKSIAAVPVIPVSIPARVLERRPDIASSERQVAAANAQIGVQRAAFFPNLALQLEAGLAGNHISNWFELPSRFWSLGPSLAGTMFEGGKRRAQVEQAQAAYDATVAAYRQAVLSALQEVDDSTVAIRQLETERKLADANIRAADRSLHIARDRYEHGTSSYLDVITAQNSLLGAMQTGTSIETRRYTAVVSLVKALGGGW